MRPSLNYTSEPPADLVSACTLSRIRQTPLASTVKKKKLYFHMAGIRLTHRYIYRLSNRAKVTLDNK